MHPFTGGASGDTRLTSDYKEDNFLEAVYSAVHETGHALYDQNTPEEWRGQPAGRTMLMNVHESQSRIMEVQAARTPEFFEFLSRTAQEVFNRPNDESLSAANLAKLVNRAKPSFIRIEADALTYTAHILLRRDLESAIIENKLSVDDLPGKWNGGMQKLLGITPANPAEGHMQDGHWPSGAIGYFPAYTLGDMMAAQLFAAATKQKPEIRDGLKTGDFKPLRDWLKDNVHGKGSLLTVDELMTQATGEKLNAKYYLDNLSRQYLGKPWTPAAAPGTQAAATLG
jgi:carboxypeptidase Taq